MRRAVSCVAVLLSNSRFSMEDTSPRLLLVPSVVHLSCWNILIDSILKDIG